MTDLNELPFVAEFVFLSTFLNIKGGAIRESLNV